MKLFKWALAVIMLFALSTGCTSKKTKEQLKNLTEENNRLKNDSIARDSSMNDMLNSFNSIEANLSLITSKQQAISSNSGNVKELDKDVRQRIMDEIKVINYLMDENTKKIESLKKQLSQSGAKNKALMETITLLENQMNDKDQQIENLKEQLVQLNFTIETLNAQVNDLQTETTRQLQMIDMQNSKIDSLNWVWYAVGTKKNLTDEGIVERDGRFLSGGRILAHEINIGRFVQADRRELQEVPVNSEKATLITPHPENSYRFNRNGKVILNLEIINPTDFWKTSRFLVIQTK
jgi:chromosome segregation ATPase